MEIQKYLEDYIEYQISQGIDYKKTISKYIACIKEFIKYMDIKTLDDVDDLTYIQIRKEWINVKKEKLSPASINLRIASLRSFLNYLEGNRLIRENVADKIKKENAKPRAVQVDVDKIQKMLKIVASEHEEKQTYLSMRNKFMINMLLMLGLRNKELRDLKIDDINFSNGEFKIIGKYSKERELYLPKELIKMYENYLSYRNMLDTKEDYLFLSKSGKYLGKNDINELVKRVSKEAGLEKYVAHSCRHVTASALIAGGSSIEDVSKILGHSSSTITSKVYVEQVKHSSRNILENNILLTKII